MQHVDQSTCPFIDLLQEPSKRMTTLQALRHPVFREESRSEKI